MLNAINRLLIRLSDKDRETFGHVQRVGALAQCWTSHYELPAQEDRQAFIVGCCVHDVGKIKIDDAILLKTSKLDPSEWDLMKTHPECGEKLMLEEGVADERLLDIVKFHHERWDGKGYPTGLRGEDIPPLARMCSIIDAFDAMISERPYKKGMTVEQAKEELAVQSGIQFDESYVRQFLSLPDSMLHNPTPVRLEKLAADGTLFYVQSFRRGK
ncbi:HD domain-containing protein [Paenibacillus mesophilus]|uniref:HD-GYP domain-containing protein n=1 Tax=Paenibacillus mesophilus TaxID=2582849 RepID=UPI00110EA6AD|nr:HD domain-containing phosphohydrolase [Paenibacillus mesophilus]TMV52861.1 HD domain-containing protein [Paenibacillus mesophilus]